VTLTINAALRTKVVPRQSAETNTSRKQTIDELLASMAWDPKERIGTFRSWLRGSLSLVHLQVITTLAADGPLSMTRLAESMDVSVASATGIVNRMEERGLVERRHESADRRVVLVHVTRRGQKVFEVMERFRRDRLAKVLDHLTDEELAAFLIGMRAMRAARTFVRSGEAAPPPRRGANRDGDA
jgi:DNA-binding MarR family transcriptional regulator